MKKIRQLFVRGLFALLPTALTIYVLYFLFSLLDSLIGNYIKALTGITIPGTGAIASIILIFLTGLIVTNVVGKKLFEFGERLLHKIPIVTKIYFGIKQIISAFSMQGKKAFNQVVLVEYPRKGIYAIGFLTGECRGEVQDKTAARLMNVFVPTTPNPTSGFLLLIPDNEIIHLDMTVEQGLKLIVSAGVVTPGDNLTAS